MLFDNRYEVVLADTESAKAIHYNLRYRVFCLEKGFEKAERFAAQMERDQFDDRAVHFLVREKRSGDWIGAARLVVGPAKSLPISQVADFELPDLHRGSVIAEFSRLLILEPHRQSFFNGVAEPEVLLGLIRAARTYCRRRGIKHWVFLCRRSLAKILSGVGLEVQQIGAPCAHRGRRVPFRLDLPHLYDNVATRSIRAHLMFNRPLSYYCYSALNSGELAA